MEAVPNSLRFEKNSVIKLIMVSVIRFSTMQVHWEFFTHLGCFFSCFKNLVKEIRDWWSEVLFVNHVESNHHVSVFVGFMARIQLTLDMTSADNLESTYHNFHLEKWESVFN